jgi:hypothetical protein
MKYLLFTLTLAFSSNAFADNIPCLHCDTHVCIGVQETKPMETIQAGDFVVGFNAETGEVENQEVIRVYKSVASELVALTYGNTTVKAMPEFPYFTSNRGWLEAQELSLGDQLVTLDGASVTLEAKESEFGDFPVVNFEVEPSHTYYACNVLVHNSGIPVNLAITGLRTFMGVGNSNLATAPFSANNGVLGTPANLNEDKTVTEIRNKAQRDAALREHGIDPKSIPPVSGLPTFATRK